MFHHFLINPAAGKKIDTEKLANVIDKTCREEGVEYRIYKTMHPHDATKYVSSTLKEMPDTKHRFYACGGDGTLGETVNGGVGNHMAEFSVIPIGTGNDFCRNFTENQNFTDIRKQIHGKAFPIDLLSVNGVYSVNMINIGFDSDVVVRMDMLRRSRFVPNKLSYIFGVLIVLFKKLGFNAKITVDGTDTFERKLLLMALANGCFCGGGFNSSPLALLDDGILDAAIVNKVSRLTFLQLVPHYKKGTYLEKKLAKKCVDYRKVKQMDIVFESPKNICIDGEIIVDNHANIKVCKGAISFSIPEGSAPISTSCASKNSESVLMNR